MSHSRDTRSAHREWIHISRLWTSGDPYLAIDAGLRGDWLGWTDSEYERVVELGPAVSSLAVGDGRAVLVGADGVVRDDSWMEIFEADGALAIVQAQGDDYPHVLADALRYPAADDIDGGILAVPSGELAFFSAASDGVGAYSTPLLPPQPGPVPLEHGQLTDDFDKGLLIRTGYASYRLRVRWYTVLDDGRFARWLLTPVRMSH